MSLTYVAHNNYYVANLPLYGYITYVTTKLGLHKACSLLMLITFPVTYSYIVRIYIYVLMNTYTSVSLRTYID